jgi:DNA-nicking Smr family endonuclease
MRKLWHRLVCRSEPYLLLQKRLDESEKARYESAYNVQKAFNDMNEEHKRKLEKLELALEACLDTHGTDNKNSRDLLKRVESRHAASARDYTEQIRKLKEELAEFRKAPRPLNLREERERCARAVHDETPQSEDIESDYDRGYQKGIQSAVSTIRDMEDQ